MSTSFVSRTTDDANIFPISRKLLSRLNRKSRRTTDEPCLFFITCAIMQRCVRIPVWELLWRGGKNRRQIDGSFCRPLTSMIPEQSPEAPEVSGDYPRNAGDPAGDGSPNFR